MELSFKKIDRSDPFAISKFEKEIKKFLILLKMKFFKNMSLKIFLIKLKIDPNSKR